MSKKYSAADVAKHNKMEDLWTIYKGKVYDITSFVDEHPGGDVLLQGAGIDSTELFDDVGHSDEATGMLKQYYIGELSD
ncbi:cytochrome b5 family protein [Acanthamoeba castellanii str. Neff]|uniref:Cytochrome b5 family protein n=1 Tax=Acanthamoeba castellanii (strain ATCC 30010 / Neff) TaxID=1257118 RepID=L8GIZ1_ACACF|nr:cytochrome b5 family protein [Acanthamoeba castellanii str. Neff]ELR12116.1 cytochrome b5 family protein [Acanthamoeba castellanii str. Neff]